MKDCLGNELMVNDFIFCRAGDEIELYQVYLDELDREEHIFVYNDGAKGVYSQKAFLEEMPSAQRIPGAQEIFSFRMQIQDLFIKEHSNELI